MTAISRRGSDLLHRMMGSKQGSLSERVLRPSPTCTGGKKTFAALHDATLGGAMRPPPYNSPSRSHPHKAVLFLLPISRTGQLNLRNEDELFLPL